MGDGNYRSMRRHYYKVESVVNSCVNPWHAAVAIKYINLWVRFLESRKKEIHKDEYEGLKVLTSHLTIQFLSKFGEQYE